MENVNPLDIIKRLDLKHNVTIRVLDEVTGAVVQEHEGHNAATNSLLTGIAHYLIGDGVLNQGMDMLSTWIPQYISLGTMGLTSQKQEEVFDPSLGKTITVPAGIGYTPVSPDSATDIEKELNARLRFEEYLNQTPGFGADGYDYSSNNNREWFGLGYPYSDKPDNLTQDFFDGTGSQTTFELSAIPLDIISITVYPDGVINEDIYNSRVSRQTISVDDYIVSDNQIIIQNAKAIPPIGSRVAIMYTIESAEAANCELITSSTLRSKITYRNIIPEVQSEIPNTLDVIFSAFVSTGALANYRSNHDYIYITEVGLWSKPSYNNSGDNGLLAGYRIMPTDDEADEVGVQETFYGDGVTNSFALQQKALNITSITVDGSVLYEYTLDTDTNSVILDDAPANQVPIIITYNTTTSWKDMSKEANRLAVQKNIIRIGPNQVAQIIWKLQLGGLAQLDGLRYIYPQQHADDVWHVWSST